MFDPNLPPIGEQKTNDNAIPEIKTVELLLTIVYKTNNTIDQLKNIKSTGPEFEQALRNIELGLAVAGRVLTTLKNKKEEVKE
jgi:hypothetical protein